MQDSVLLDPTAEMQPMVRSRRVPPADIQGLTVGLLDIGKARGNVFLDRLETGLSGHGLKVARFAKPTNTKVAPVAVAQAIAERCDLVVEALSDWGSCTSCSLHDMRDLDERGVPGAMVATTAFEQAARAQSQSLGFEPAIVYVPHPIQDRTDDEINQIADEALGSILEVLQS